MWLGLAVAANRVLPGVLVVSLAWWIEPKQLGIVSFVLACYSILLPISDWSIAYALQKLLPEDSSRTRQVSWTAFLMRLGVSIVLGIICWTLDVARDVFHGYGVYLAVLLVSSAFGTIVYIHNALCNFVKGSLYSIATQVMWVVIALVLVKVGMPVTGPILGLIISFSLLGIFTLLFDPALRGGVAFLPRIAAEIAHFGLWATVAVVLSGFAGQIGILVVDYVNGDAAAGIFKIATAFGVVPALLGMIVVLPLMPVARQGFLDGHDVVTGLVRPILRYLLMLGLPITAAGFVLAPAVIGTFTRHTYSGAVWPLRIVLGGNFLRMLITALSGILFVGDGLRVLAKIYGAMAVICLVAGVLLARRWGSTGMAVAFLISWIVGMALIWRWFRRNTAVQPEWKVYMRQTGSALVMATVVYFSVRLIHPALVQFLVGACLAVGIYPLLLWWQGDFAIRDLVNSLWNQSAG